MTLLGLTITIVRALSDKRNSDITLYSREPSTMVSLTGPALLLLLLVSISICGTIQEVGAFLVTVPPPSSCSFRHATPLCSNSINNGRRTETKNSSLHATFLDIAKSSGIVESMISALILGDTVAAAAPGASSDLGVILGGVLTVVVFTVAQGLLVDSTTQTSDEDAIKDDNDKVTASSSSSSSSSSSRRVRSSRHNVGLVGRRSTLTTLIGGALGFAASDMILGAAGNILLGGGGGGIAATTTTAAASFSSSSVYGARWNALFQRIATASAKHEAAIASPELVSWISKSPAALANPELRAWIAAQRAFHKGRQAALAAAVVLEEGMAAVTATATATRAVVTAAAAVVTKQKSGAKDGDNNNVYNDDDVDDFDTSLQNSAAPAAATSATSFKVTSEDSDLLSPTALSASTFTALENSDMETSNATLNNKDDEEYGTR